MQYRPKLELILTRRDKQLEIAGVVVLILIWLLTIFAFITLPETIAVHFSLSGEPDRYGGKGTLLILPAIASAVFALLSFINRYPQSFNFLQNVTEENAERLYRGATRMMRVIKLIVMLLLFTIVLFTWLVGTGKAAGVSTWVLIPFLLAMLIIPIYTAFSTGNLIKQQ